MILRPYQKDIIDQAIATDRLTLIQIPTGGGKTVIAKEIALNLVARGQQVVFLAPKIVLMEQTAETFKGLKPHIVHGNNKYDKNHHVLISTIQTMSRRNDIDPDVFIIDEIHYGYSGEMLSKLRKEKKNSRIIGLSATPYDQDGVLLKGFDVVLDRYDLDYMIENDYLVPVKSYKPMTPKNLNKIDTVAGDYHLGQLSKLMGDKNAVMEVVSATRKYIEESKKTIVFAVDIHHAELLSKAYFNAGFNADVVHSDMDRQTIDKKLFLFRNGHIKVLVSVSMLTTGFDVPDVDTAVIARPTKSQNLYKQMVGRIMRLAPDKKYGNLLDCGGVIDNLGLPTEKIKVKKAPEVFSKDFCCFKCGSKKLTPKKISGKIYWVCSTCGAKKEAKSSREYQCEKCSKTYTQDANLILDGNSLKLFCLCGHRTTISNPVDKDILQEVQDVSHKQIDSIVKRYKQDHKKYIESHIASKRKTMSNTEISAYQASDTFMKMMYQIEKTVFNHFNDHEKLILKSQVKFMNPEL